MTDTLEAQIGEWRAALEAGSVDAGALDELESHLRDQVDDLTAAGLSDDEAFLIAVKRIGGVDEIGREYAREHGARLWKQLVPPVEGRPGGLTLALALAAAAAVLVHLPRLWGDPADDPTRLLLNAPWIVLACLGAFFAVRRGLPPRAVAAPALAFAAGAIAVNLYPWADTGDTLLLAVLALPGALWFVVATAYMGGSWRSHERRMDFIRFTGEWVIYYALIALGGGVLVGLVSVLLGDAFVEWVLMSGAAGAVVVAAWLVESKQSVVENMAPVLTNVFTPLFAVLLLASVVDHLARGLAFDRTALGVYDALMVVVFGLVLYATSARDGDRPPGWMDRIQLVAVVAALVLDALVLGSMLVRIGELGLTPNRVATLSLNIVLAANLVWAAWLATRFVAGREVFHRLERWQTAYLPVFGLWAGAVALVLPVVFDFS